MHRFAMSASILALLAGLSSLMVASLAKAKGAEDAEQSSSMLEPGQWQFDTQTKELRIPGIPPDYRAKQIALERSGEILTRVALRQPR